MSRHSIVYAYRITSSPSDENTVLFYRVINIPFLRICVPDYVLGVPGLARGSSLDYSFKQESRDTL